MMRSPRTSAPVAMFSFTSKTAAGHNGSFPATHRGKNGIGIELKKTQAVAFEPVVEPPNLLHPFF